MKPLVITLLLVPLCLSGCKKGTSNSQQPGSVASAPASAPASEQLDSPAAAIETKYFKGSIGSALGLQMKLAREGDKLTGSYFYQKVGTKIDLRGSVDKDSNVVLEEFDANGKQTGVFKGLWAIDAEDGMVNIAGNWSKPDGQKKTAFSLHEEPIRFSGGIDIIPKPIKETNKKLKYEIEVEYPQLTGLLSPGFEKFNQEVKRVVLREVTKFRKDMIPEAGVEEPPEQSSVPGSTLDMGYTVALATDDLISIEMDVGTYYHGAAHPNSNSEVLNFDVRNGKALRLADLFKPGAKYLQALSTYSIKDLKKQSSSKGADGMLDDQSIASGAGAAAKNFQSWTITKKGLGITFDSYQVGPYAAGPQYVLIPYSVLKEIIDTNGALGPLIRSQL